MTKGYPCRREDWFVPHETTISLPDGREITVDGIPYEGWGTTPGRWGYLVDYVELPDGSFDFSRSITWLVPPPDYHHHPKGDQPSLSAPNEGNH